MVLFLHARCPVCTNELGLNMYNVRTSELVMTLLLHHISLSLVWV